MASALAATSTTMFSRLLSAPSTQHRPRAVDSANFTAQRLCFDAPRRRWSPSVKNVHVSSRNERQVVGVAVASAWVAQSANAGKIAQKFADLKAIGKVAMVSYITAGDPDIETTAEAMKILDECGVNIIELGVPYSDPLADGPVIQAATARALQKGTTLDMVLDMLRTVAPDIKAPIVLFTYYNPILKRGQKNFLKAIKAAGASGLVVPDLPLEEAEKLRELTTAMGIDLILLTTPTTPQARMEVIAEAAQGFLYLVSLTGVTGARTSVQSSVEGLLVDLKQVTDKPVAVGFGISTPEQAAQVAEWGADGVILGSAMVKILGESASPQEGLLGLKAFTNDLMAALAWSEFKMEMNL